MARRKDAQYFPRIPGTPRPLSFCVKRRVAFSEVDAMGIVWYGRYTQYFEEASQELGRRCGLGYQDFYQANLRAPIVQFHIDYHQSLLLDEEITVQAAAPWCEGAKFVIEFEIRRAGGILAATAYTVQMFVTGDSKEVLIVTPELLERARKRWLAGEFACLQ